MTTITGYWTGKKRPPFSAEWKRKMSESRTGKVSSLKGKKRPDWVVEKIRATQKRRYAEGTMFVPSAKGRKFTDEHRRKLSEAHRGDKSIYWLGGITPVNKAIRKTFEYKMWRESVFERDDYTCIWCGARNGNGKKIVLNADHIKPFYKHPELRFDINNGRTLCVDCHRTTDTFKMRHTR